LVVEVQLLDDGRPRSGGTLGLVVLVGSWAEVLVGVKCLLAHRREGVFVGFAPRLVVRLRGGGPDGSLSVGGAARWRGPDFLLIAAATVVVVAPLARELARLLGGAILVALDLLGDGTEVLAAVVGELLLSGSEGGGCRSGLALGRLVVDGTLRLLG